MKKLYCFSLTVVLLTVFWLPISPPHAAASDLRITRLHLYFSNNRAEITVKRQEPDLHIFVDINFRGAGLLQSHWEVDGRIIGRVSQHLVPIEKPKTLTSPKIPDLPTCSTGGHRVKFVVTQPKQAIVFPVAVYFVTAEKYFKRLAIKLQTPADGISLGSAPVNFTWYKHKDINAYCIEFNKKQEEKPLFSAYVFDASYMMETTVLNILFSEGDEYLWQVTGTDADGKIIAQSEVFRFRWKKKK